MKHLFAVVLSLLLLSVSLVARAERGGPLSGPRPDGMEIFEGLGLTPQQKTQIEAHLKEKKEVNQKNLEALKAAGQKFDAALRADASDEEMIKVERESEAARAAANNARFQQMLTLRRILTKEQRKKLEDKRRSRLGLPMDPNRK